ncbi:MAG TPA: SBBP repeat-containing protein [Bryobacterales bacterium]|nr:SBBP repeat-containing protein [Bryobacterales bacterium]
MSYSVVDGLPLRFEANRGQAAGGAQFVARGRGYTLLLEPAETELRLRGPRGAAAWRMKFAGAAAGARMEGLERRPGASSYFLGSDPAQWRTGIPSYARVRARGIYAGVDVVYYGDHRQLEYDLVVAPGADWRAIRLAFKGARGLRVDGSGDLVIDVGVGEIRQRRPAVYQEVNGERRTVAGRYVLQGKREAGFEVGTYDRTRPLIIDPILRFATFFGGSGDDAGRGIAVDSAGNIYVAGTTSSADVRVLNAAQMTPGGGQDVFVLKLNSLGTTVLYATYLGGGADDTAAGIGVDAAGNAYVAGTTASVNFPTTAGAAQAVFGGGASDAFVTKLDAAGTMLYSTYIGGSDADLAGGIAVDAAGSAYVTGTTSSTNFPFTNGAFQTFLKASADVFVTKLNAVGSGFAYSTFLGGDLKDQGFGIAVDASGNAYVTGATVSTNFPRTTNSYQPSCMGPPTPFGVSCADAFVTKLNAAGSALVYSTFLGGQATDVGVAIALDAYGNAYIAGTTNSVDFPVSAGAFQPTLGGGPEDIFVTKLNTTGTMLVYSSFLGGKGDDVVGGIALDTAGDAYLAGSTTSGNFPAPNGLQTMCAGLTSSCADAFLTKVNANASGLIYSTYFGGTSVDQAFGVAVSASGVAYITGQTQSTDFPVTAGSVQTAFGGSKDAFVAKIAETNPAPTLTSISPATALAGGPGFTLTVNGTGLVNESVVRWNGSDRPTTFVSETQVTAAITAGDIAAQGTAQVTVFNPTPGGGVTAPLTFVIGVNPPPMISLLSPPSVVAGGTDLALVVNGSGFVNTSVARWNGSDRKTTFLNVNQVQALITAADIATAGAAQVTVFNPAPGGGLSNVAPFVINNPAPAIASLAPASAPAGGTAFTLTVNGVGFALGAVVRWNGSARPTTFLSGTQLRASIAAADIAAAGAAQVTVLNPTPGGGSSGVAVFTISAAPVISPSGVVNAASFGGGQPIAAGTIAAVFGSNLAGAIVQASTLPLPPALAGVSVLVNGQPAPLFFVSPLQINFLVPWEVQGQSQISVSVQSGGVTSAAQTVNLTPAGPALFATNQQGTGQGAVLISGTASLAAPAGAYPGSRPVRRGEYIEIYGVGLGAVTNQPASGAAALSSPLSSTTTMPVVTIGGAPATVIFSGLAPGFAGLYQVNVQVPDNALAGNAAPVALSVGGVNANTVTIAVQ